MYLIFWTLYHSQLMYFFVKVEKSIVATYLKKKSQEKKLYSQTCVQRPPLGPQNSGRCRQAVVVQR